MAHFAVDEIHALLLTAASKAGISHLDKQGFETLAEEIEKAIPRTAHGVYLSYRYLRESVYDKLMDALEEGEEELGFNRDYIDTLCQFTGYKSFNTFHDHFQKWNKELQALTSDPAHVAILFSQEDQTSAEELQQIAELNKMECIPRSLLNNGEEMHNLPEEVLFAIMVFGQSLYSDDTLNLTSRWAENISSPIFIYLPDPEFKSNIPEEWTDRPILEPDDRHLFFSVAKMYIKGILRKKGRIVSNGSSMHIHAQNIGTIFMGNTHIEASFSARENMNLANHKHKRR